MGVFRDFGRVTRVGRLRPGVFSVGMVWMAGLEVWLKRAASFA